MKTRSSGKRALLLTAALLTSLATAGAMAGMHGGAGPARGMQHGSSDTPRGGMMGEGSGMSQMMGGSGMRGMMASCPMMQGGGGMGGMMGGQRGMMPGMKSPMDMSGIDLTDDQQSQARELRHAHREEQYQRKARMMNLREDMHALMRSDSPDPDAVRDLHGRMAEVHGAMLADHVRLRNAMREMLTDEQREALDAGARQEAVPESGTDEHADHH